MREKFNNPICGECGKKIDILTEEFVTIWYDNKIFHKSCYKNPVDEFKKALMESYLGKFMFWILDRLLQLINWVRKIMNGLKSH